MFKAAERELPMSENPVSHAATSSAPAPHGSGRVASIDALRGFDMFWITGGDALVYHLSRAVPIPLTLMLAGQFRHVDWEGFHFYDLIFPLFVFIVGLVLPFSLTRRLEAGADRHELYRHAVRRLFLLFFLGLLANGLLDLNFHDLRLLGVLQRIAIAYFFATLLVMNLDVRGQAVATAAILLGYWALMAWVSVPGFGRGNYTMQGNLAAFLDQRFLPRPFCCYDYGDNEGIISNIPAIATCMLGAMAGHWLRTSYSQKRKLLGLTVAGVVSLAVGLLWSLAFPIVKNIWSSSFVLFAGGWSLLLLALFYWIIDVRGYRKWAFVFTIIGANSITIYLARHFFNFREVGLIFTHGFINLLGAWKPFAIELGSVVAGWVFLYYLYRRKLFLRV
jgi:predicted acyltransferase